VITKVNRDLCFGRNDELLGIWYHRDMYVYIVKMQPMRSSKNGEVRATFRRTSWNVACQLKRDRTLESGTITLPAREARLIDYSNYAILVVC
jgi:hypothetical protein